VDAALAALEAVEGRDTSIEAILARHGEQRLDLKEFERHCGSLRPTTRADDGGREPVGFETPQIREPGRYMSAV
jgi:hypothetical protein